ncbi:MAG: hypothetical protein D6754_16345, partial [Alphaproteobacteria bacterium]
MFAVSSWTRNGQASGSIRHVARIDGLVLSDTWRACGDPPEEVCAFVPITWTPCNPGGHRRWIACPRCGRRVAKLYGAGRRFLCRHSHRLPHASQSEDAIACRFRRANRIRELLEESPFHGEGYRKVWARLRFSG